MKNKSRFKNAAAVVERNLNITEKLKNLFFMCAHTFSLHSFVHTFRFVFPYNIYTEKKSLFILIFINEYEKQQ